MTGASRQGKTKMYRTLVSGVVVVVALTGCAASGPGEQELEAQAQHKQEALEDILNTPLTAEDYGGKGERCLSTHAYRSVDILDDQHMLFRGSGGKLWLNRLRHRCLGLRPNDILRFELRSNRVCELDTFQSYDSFGLASRFSGNCTLGAFQPVTPEQAEAIQIAFQEAKKS